MPSAKVRGCNYASEEDVSLARAWVRVSEDPVVGSEQKSTTFYDKIWNEYKAMKPADLAVRPVASVTSRIKLIIKQCVRFSACHSTVLASKPTGVNETDILRLSIALFNGKKIKSPDEDIGKPFKFQAAWDVLRFHEKFLAGANGSNSSSDQKSAQDNVQRDVKPEACGLAKDESSKEGAARSVGRPTGRRKAKEQEQKAHNSRKKLKIAEEALKLQEKRNLALTRHNEILLFTHGPGGVESEGAKEYFKLMQEEALDAIREKAAARKAQRSFCTAGLQPSGLQPSDVTVPDDVLQPNCVEHSTGERDDCDASNESIASGAVVCD